MTASVDFTISYEDADEDGWIVAQVLEVPGALSQGRTRQEARVNVLDALATVLTPDVEPGGNEKNVPRHKEIGPGLMRAVCKQLGIPPPTGPRQAGF